MSSFFETPPLTRTSSGSGVDDNDTIFHTADLQWEQCTRLLLTNTLPSLVELVDTMHTIVTNILHDAREAESEGIGRNLEIKYLNIRSTNAIIMRKLLMMFLEPWSMVGNSSQESLVKLHGLAVGNFEPCFRSILLICDLAY
jgi:hypothetical protein